MKTIEAFFKRKTPETTPKENKSNSNDLVSKKQKVQVQVEVEEEFDIENLERDPGLRRQIMKYPVELRDEVRRGYLKLGPYQPKLKTYPKSREKHSRSFQPSWYDLFSWLEYSPDKNAVFCLPCFLFKKDHGNRGANAFTVKGFQTWKKVKDGAKCALLCHMGKGSNSTHIKAEKACADLLDQSSHITNRIEKFNSQEAKETRVRLKTSVTAVRWLSYQGCALRGNDESETSLNRGNFLELRALIVEFNEEVAKALKNSPRNGLYTSPKVQKEILRVMGNKVKKAIREQIGDAKYCLLVDEARDESKREQMSIVLRFVDRDGYIQERFFGLIHVKDTKAVTLRDGIFSLLAQHDLDVMSIRGQGYDGASNMRGEFNGLQALVSKECPQAYFVHCFAHRLQLALVAASNGVKTLCLFFKQLSSIINVASGSSKRNDQLKDAHASNVDFLLGIGELERGSGKNQIGSLARACDTRWSSHLRSIHSLLKMYSATCEVLMNIGDDKDTSQAVDAGAAYDDLTSIEFIFLLHIMKAILEIFDTLCQALQVQTQDILNAMNLVSDTKRLMQQFRDEGWVKIVEDVRNFCQKVSITFPDLCAPLIPRRGRPRHQEEIKTEEEYYRANFFYAAIDTQMSEMDTRFNENAMELMSLSSALDPRDMCKSFRLDDICKLVEKFYSMDFGEHERLQLCPQFACFACVREHKGFKDLKSLSDLCQCMVKTGKSMSHPLVYRLVTLILTLPVSTASTERSFSAMNIIKNARRNKMEDGFLSDSLLVYIEKEISLHFSVDSIVDDFRDMAERRYLF